MDVRVLAILALAFLGFGAISRRAERSVLTAPMVFVGLGLLLSSEHGLGLSVVSSGRAVIDHVGVIALVLVLFTDAARIDLKCLRQEGSLPARLLGVSLPLTIVAGGALAFALLDGFGVWDALLLAAILAPTDAALGQAVVSSSLVPVRIRQTLNVESGLNDGIALPVVLLAAFLSGATEGEGGVGYWTRFVALQIGLAPLVGIAVGYLGGRLILRTTDAGWMNEPFRELSALGLAVLAYAGAEVVGGNGFIAAFVSGLALGNTTRGLCRSLYEFGEAEGQLLSLLVFMLFGAVMVPEVLGHLMPVHFVYAVLSLTVVRMLPVALSLVGAGLRPVSVAFIGWFGPRGLASILYVLIVLEKGQLSSAATLESVVVLTVLLSTFAHGISAYPLARRYGTAVALAGEEQKPAEVMPVRVRFAPHD